MTRNSYAARVLGRHQREVRSTFRGLQAMGAVEIYDKTPAYLVAPKYHKLQGVYSDTATDREMLLRLGAGEMGATLSIPYLPFTPAGSDPDAQGIIQIVECLQYGMNQLGCRLRTDGFLGHETVYCLKQVSGTGWHIKSWLQLMGDVIGAIDAGKRIRPGQPQAVGAYYSDLGADPLPVVYSNEWETVNGVCRPKNEYTLNLYKDMQRQLNRVAYARKKSFVGVDGRIGAQTVNAVKELLGNEEVSLIDKIMGFFGTASAPCDAVARDADAIRNSAKRVADAAGVPQTVREPASQPSVKLPSGAIAHPPDRSWAKWLVGAAVVGGGYWYLKKKKPKRKKRG